MDQPQVMEILAKILDSQNELRKNQEFTNQEVKAMNQKMNGMNQEMKAMNQDFNTKQDAMNQDFNTKQDAMSQDFNTKQDAMSQDFNTKQDAMGKKLEKIEFSIEHDITIKISALYDSREVQKDHNIRVDEALDRIEKKVEVLQLETSSLRRIK